MVISVEMSNNLCIYRQLVVFMPLCRRRATVGGEQLETAVPVNPAPEQFVPEPYNIRALSHFPLIVYH